MVDPAAAPLADGVGGLGFPCDTLVTDLDYLAFAASPARTASGKLQTQAIKASLASSVIS